MKHFARIAFTLSFVTAGLACAQYVTAQSKTMSSQSAAPAAIQQEPSTGKFVKKRYSMNGEWSVIEADGKTQIRFSDDFRTKGGPDLKVFLSKTPIDELDSQTAGMNVTSIGVLKSKSGGQIYTVPSDITLSDYKSVIIHCEAFSVLWGGFDLPTPSSLQP